MSNQKQNKETEQTRKEDKPMSEVMFESAYEKISKKGTPMIVLKDVNGNYHYIELKRRTKYNQYNGEAYESKEHLAYTFITEEDTKDNNDSAI